MHDAVGLLRRTAAPLALLVAGLVLPGHILETSGRFSGMQGAPGPDAWPRIMLLGIVVTAALWLAREVWLFARRDGRAAAAPAAADQAEPYDNVRAVIGIALTGAYGVALPIIGFPLATLLFVIAWCVLGSVRRPVTLGAVGVLGTVVLLYIFVRLARMPLDRGVGVFDAITVGLYQALGIY